MAAALQLAKAGDARAVEGLRKGLALPSSADACSLALISMCCGGALATGTIIERI